MLGHIIKIDDLTALWTPIEHGDKLIAIWGAKVRGIKTKWRHEKLYYLYRTDDPTVYLAFPGRDGDSTKLTPYEHDCDFDKIWTHYKVDREYDEEGNLLSETEDSSTRVLPINLGKSHEVPQAVIVESIERLDDENIRM